MLTDEDVYNTQQETSISLITRDVYNVIGYHNDDEDDDCDNHGYDGNLIEDASQGQQQ